MQRCEAFPFSNMENKGKDKDKRLVVAVVPVNSAVERAVLRGVAVAAARFGWTLETIDPSLPGIDFALFAQLLSQADGVVVRLRESWEKVRPMLRPDTPVVGIDIMPQCSSGLWATVNPENAKIGAMAADELLAAHLRCYAFVPALPKMPWGDARGKGFLERVRIAGGDARRYEPRSVWTCAAELGELSRWLSQLPRPFGLFARNDLLAKFALGACKGAGIDVPGEASIIGADDDESICLYSTPTLSSVRIDHEGGGRRAAEALRGYFGKPPPRKAASLRLGPMESRTAQAPAPPRMAPTCALRPDWTSSPATPTTLPSASRTSPPRWESAVAKLRGFSPPRA